MSVLLSGAITLTAGKLYPAYRSYKAIRTKDVEESLADIFMSFGPWTKGASILYQKWIHPTLSKREQDIAHASHPVVRTAEAALRGQRSSSPGDEHRKLIRVEGIEEIDDEDGEHDKSPTCRPKNRSRSRSVEAGANKFVTMSRRSQRRPTHSCRTSHKMRFPCTI
ncbi:unnamed protein product [Haemonchus placei]|uniref:DUF1279 domain-containing protein n=1 Tax=Haemonchus placei TaxID=6290 RepID=A0A0N4X681_HAEPC|nr:unnamed protein product [Haemonchus placei]